MRASRDARALVSCSCVAARTARIVETIPPPALAIVS